MTVSLDAMINWYMSREDRLTYSMTGSRNGTDGTADCSGSMTQAIKDAGGTPYSYLYSTVTLPAYLQANGFARIVQNAAWTGKKGDVILMSGGSDMASSGGAGGHVGMLKSDDTGNGGIFISTDYWTNGQTGTAVSEHAWNDYYAACFVPNGDLQYMEVWRLAETAAPQPQAPAQPQIPVGAGYVYRLSNSGSGQHVLSVDSKEVFGLVQAGWKYEGVMFTAATSGSNPVYRLNNTEHLYSADYKEIAALTASGWKNEGAVFQNLGTVPVHRLYNSGKHLYSIDPNEIKGLTAQGWKDEGVAFNVLKAGQ